MQGCRDVAYAPGVVRLREVKLQDDAGPEHRGRLRRARESERVRVRGRERERERAKYAEHAELESFRRAHAKSPGRRRSARCCARASVQCEQYLTAGTLSGSPFRRSGFEILSSMPLLVGKSRTCHLGIVAVHVEGLYQGVHTIFYLVFARFPSLVTAIAADKTSKFPCSKTANSAQFARSLGGCNFCPMAFA